jgi:hypothetical protein
MNATNSRQRNIPRDIIKIKKIKINGFREVFEVAMYISRHPANVIFTTWRQEKKKKKSRDQTFRRFHIFKHIIYTT